MLFLIVNPDIELKLHKMKKILWLIVVIVFIAFVVAQFFRPEKNNGEITSDHILRQENIPEDVRVILTNSCLDCHSNTTNYQWFHHVVPVTWMINDHITEGKDELNFSDWGKLDAFSKMDALDEMCEEVEKGNMPIKSYAAIHSKARLSEEEKKILCDWTSNLTQELMAASVQ